MSIAFLSYALTNLVNAIGIFALVTFTSFSTWLTKLKNCLTDLVIDFVTCGTDFSIVVIVIVVITVVIVSLSDLVTDLVTDFVTCVMF